jgi:uncharacterized membrane protein YtjA (UPF0391 family)
MQRAVIAEITSLSPHRRFAMLRTIILLLLIALAAGMLGFGGVEGVALWMIRVLLLVFVVLLIVSLVAGGRAAPRL